MTTTQFPNHFREDLYWISESGRLLGVLPCLGGGPKSFLSATLDPGKPPSPPRQGQQGTREGEGEGEGEEGEGGGEEEGERLFVYFSDGRGAVCCVQPQVQ